MSIFLRNYILMSLMLLSLVLAIVMRPIDKIADHQEKFDLETMIPKQFGKWHAELFSPSSIKLAPIENETVNKTYNQIISRNYVDENGHTVILSIGYGESQWQGLRVHRQEVCYSAQGFLISDLSNPILFIDGRAIKATRLVASKGSRTEPVTYWFTMGDKVVRSYFERQREQFEYSLKGFIPDGYLFRVSSIGDNVDEQFQLQQNFSEELLSVLPENFKVRLIGKAVISN